MIVKILNTGNLQGEHITLNDPKTYIFQSVVALEQKQHSMSFSWGWSTVSFIKMTLADGTEKEIVANNDVYVCDDNGKTIEKFTHDSGLNPNLDCFNCDDAEKDIKESIGTIGSQPLAASSMGSDQKRSGLF